MMTVSKAYQLLKAEGYITTGRRDGVDIFFGLILASRPFDCSNEIEGLRVMT